MSKVRFWTLIVVCSGIALTGVSYLVEKNGKASIQCFDDYRPRPSVISGSFVSSLQFQKIHGFPLSYYLEKLPADEKKCISGDDRANFKPASWRWPELFGDGVFWVAISTLLVILPWKSKKALS